MEARQRALERFLHRVASHTELSTAEPFIIFLQSDDSGLMVTIEESKASAPKISQRLGSWIEGTVNSIQNSGKVILFLSIYYYYLILIAG